MKIKKIGLNNYGRFGSKDLDLEFDRGLNVVYGRNEAGKSTLRNALSELMYGFQAKKAEKHPYYTSGALNLTGEYFDDRNEVITVQRTLDAHAEGQKIIGSHIADIGNVTINEMNAVPFLLYKGLFEMDLADLIKLDDRKWSEVEEQIALQYGLSNMLTPQQVLSSLEDEMHLLWRPHNRGKYKVKDIDEKLLELGDKRRELKRTRKDFEGKLKQKKEIETEIQNVSKAMAEKTQWLENSEAQLEAYRNLSEIRVIETELAAQEYSHLQLDEYSYLVRENEKLRDEKAELDKEIGDLQLGRVKLTELESTLIASDGDRFSEIYHVYKSTLDSYCEAREDLKRSRIAVENKSLELTADPWNDALMNYWSVINIAELDKAVRRRMLFSFRSGLPWILILLGTAIAAAGYYYEENLLLGAGGLVAAASVMAMLGSMSNKPFEFGEIQFNDGIWHNRDVFIEACDKMKQLADGFGQKAEKVESYRSTFKNSKRVLEDTLKQYGLDTEENLDASIAKVHSSLKSSKTKSQDLKLYQSSLSSLNGRKRKLSHTLMMNQQKLNVFKNELVKISDSTEEALSRLEQLAALELRRNILLQKLEVFDKEHPEWTEYRKFSDFDQRVENAKTEHDALRSQREELRIKLMALVKDEERAFEDQRLDAIEAQIEMLECERASVINEYNELRMMHSIISFADETFRKKYQPNLLKRASKLMSAFTDGHYDVIVTSGNGELQINDTKKGQFIPVHDRLSRGTLEQVYMAMRLAIAETIDKTDQKLPLVLDEVFVNWDHERLENALLAIQEISKERQIVYLTCHDWMADKMSSYYGASKIDLTING